MTHKAIETTIYRLSERFQYTSSPKESGQSAHPWSRKMAKYSSWNTSRDFWRMCRLPIDTWLSNPSALCTCTCTCHLIQHEDCCSILQRFMCQKWCEMYSVPDIAHIISTTAVVVVITTEEHIKIKVPLKSKRSPKGFEFHEIDILDPLSVVSYLFNEVGLTIPPENVRSYWDHYRRKVAAPWALRHPAKDDAIPLGLYGDACKIRQGGKMVGIYMNLPLFRPKSIRCSRFLLVAIQEELMYKRKSLDCIWRQIIWRMNLLLEGKYPQCDIDRQPLQGPQLKKAGQEIVPGKTFAVAELRGDWLWMKQCFSFKSSWKGGSKYPVCFQCEARAKEPHLYYNVRHDSSVWETEYPTLTEFLIRQMPSDPSDLNAHCICFRAIFAFIRYVCKLSYHWGPFWPPLAIVGNQDFDSISSSKVLWLPFGALIPELYVGALCT